MCPVQESLRCNHASCLGCGLVCGQDTLRRGMAHCIPVAWLHIFLFFNSMSMSQFLEAEAYFRKAEVVGHDIRGTSRIQELFKEKPQLLRAFAKAI